MVPILNHRFIHEFIHEYIDSVWSANSLGSSRHPAVFWGEGRRGTFCCDVNRSRVGASGASPRQRSPRVPSMTECQWGRGLGGLAPGDWRSPCNLVLLPSKTHTLCLLEATKSQGSHTCPLSPFSRSLSVSKIQERHTALSTSSRCQAPKPHPCLPPTKPLLLSSPQKASDVPTGYVTSSAQGQPVL